MVMSKSEAGKLGALKAHQKRKIQLYRDYMSNPKKCPNCNTVIPYEIRHKKNYCNQSCSASYNNHKKTKRKKIVSKNCLNCNNVLNKRYSQKYCNINCQMEFRYKKNKKMFEDGINLKIGPSGLRRFIKKYYNETCQDCGNTYWMTNKIPLEVHHIDGDHFNNTKKNLNLLCLNCHGLTSNYKAKNKNSTRTYRRREKIMII